MWTRFLNLVSTSPLISAIVGTFIGTVFATQYVAWKAPDVSSYLGGLGRWLRAPAGATHNDIITLAVVAILLGFISCAAIFLREYLKLPRRERPVTPAAAPAPASVTPTNTSPPLEKTDLSVLRVIAGDGKDANVLLTTICQRLRLTEQRVVLACERLSQNYFVISNGSDRSGTRLFALTAAGREECHRHGWI
jgi:uncharacterized MnhB-related membrane protein